MKEQLEFLPVNEPIEVTEQQFKSIRKKYDGYVFFRESHGQYFIKIATYKSDIRTGIKKILAT